MPNWCYNTLSVIAPDADTLNDIVSHLQISGDQLEEITPVSFQNVISEPVNLGDISPNYWRLQNWGTKWDACQVHVMFQDETSITYSFDTADAPPLKAMPVLSLQYPTCLIALSYDEPSMDFGGYRVYNSGQEAESAEAGSKMGSWADSVDSVIDYLWDEFSTEPQQHAAPPF